GSADLRLAARRTVVPRRLPQLLCDHPLQRQSALRDGRPRSGAGHSAAGTGSGRVGRPGRSGRCGRAVSVADGSRCPWRTAAAASALLTLAGCSVMSQRAARPPPPAPPPPPSAPVAPSTEVETPPDAVPRAEPRSAHGNPPFYDVLGQRYYVLAAADGYVERGVASWYGPTFHGGNTSSGEPYDMYAMTAAHKTLPLPCYARVTNLRNGKSVVVRINDRGP